MKDLSVNKFIRVLANLHNGERGIARLETVIIVIAFAVVAASAIFALLNGGVFIAQRSKETINAGVQQVKRYLEISDSVIVKCTDNERIRYILLMVRNTAAADPIDMTPCDGTLSAPNKTVIDFSTATDCLNNVKWTKRAIGAADKDNLLEIGEQFEVTIDLVDLGEGKALTIPLGVNSQFKIEIKPAPGSIIIVQRDLPAGLDKVMDLH
jgi:archaellin